jgi:hypothetical protein
MLIFNKTPLYHFNMSKHAEIRKHLQAGHSLTGLEAIELYSVYRLSSVINRLRREGLGIETSMITASDGKTIFAKYWIPIYSRRK